MLVTEIIRKKRDGMPLGADEITEFVKGVTAETTSDAQIAAFAMATLLNGMTKNETVSLTLAMRDSGHVYDWTDIAAPVVDKHSTGGVGDNTSLMLAPILAACGAYVPMISGRGLGHTGGTLDKMESIPGYNVTPNNTLFAQVVQQTGCAIIGQTSRLAPADKRIYSVRDVTSTVESIPLITASILSKKLSAGLGSLVMDVKFGNGAFMSDFDQAQALALSIVEVAQKAGLSCHAALTDMNQPLADAAGNAVEVQNAIAFLSGLRQEPRLMDVILTLSSEMLVTAGITSDRTSAAQKVRNVLDAGYAAEKFEQMVAALGGPSDILKSHMSYLPRSKITSTVLAPVSGYVQKIETRDVGLSVVQLGGGRKLASDKVDPSVGLENLAPLGTKLNAGDPIATIHAQTQNDAERAAAQILAAYTIAQPPEIGPAVREIIT